MAGQGSPNHTGTTHVEKSSVECRRRPRRHAGRPLRAGHLLLGRSRGNRRDRGAPRGVAAVGAGTGHRHHRRGTGEQAGHRSARPRPLRAEPQDVQQHHHPDQPLALAARFAAAGRLAGRGGIAVRHLRRRCLYRAPQRQQHHAVGHRARGSAAWAARHALRPQHTGRCDQVRLALTGRGRLAQRQRRCGQLQPAARQPERGRQALRRLGGLLLGALHQQGWPVLQPQPHEGREDRSRAQLRRPRQAALHGSRRPRCDGLLLLRRRGQRRRPADSGDHAGSGLEQAVHLERSRAAVRQLCAQHTERRAHEPRQLPVR